MYAPRPCGVIAAVNLIVCSATALQLSAQAQPKSSSASDPSGTSVPGGLPVVKLDLVSRTFDKALPFDEPFLLQIPFAVQTTTKPAPSIGKLSYGLVTDDDTTEVCNPIGKNLGRLDDPGTSSPATFRIKALPANKRVVFLVELVKVPDTSVGKLRPFAIGSGTPGLLAVGRTATTYKDYFRTDIGFSYAPTLLTGAAPRPSYWGGGSNVHFYFVPINDQQRLTDLHGWDNVFKRVSLFAGLTIFDLRSDVPIDHMYSAGTPVAGVGLRPWIRDDWAGLNSLFLNVGVMWFDQKDANPLLLKEHGKRTRFIGVGGMIDWKDILGPLAFLVGSKS